MALIDMKHVDVLYLCDGQACARINRSCMTDGMCRHTSKPEHAVNGYCERPDLAFDRFDEVSKFGIGGINLVLYIERDDYVGKEAKS